MKKESSKKTTPTVRPKKIDLFFFIFLLPPFFAKPLWGVATLHSIHFIHTLFMPVMFHHLHVDYYHNDKSQDFDNQRTLPNL